MPDARERADDPLRRLKADLEQEFLGRGGIHAIGLSLARNAIRLYLASEPAPEEQATVDRVRRRAAPFDVIVERAGAARITR